jgi:small nuclear ribonucleoprotein G
MDKKLSLKLNGGRNVQGILRGFDPFMNVVVDEALELCKDGKKNEIGMVVRELTNLKLLLDHSELEIYSLQVIRGNSIIMVEALERI